MYYISASDFQVYSLSIIFFRIKKLIIEINLFIFVFIQNTFINNIIDDVLKMFLQFYLDELYRFYTLIRTDNIL